MRRARYIPVALLAFAVASGQAGAQEAPATAQVVSATVAENTIGVAVAPDGTPVASASTVPVTVHVRRDGNVRTFVVAPR